MTEWENCVLASAGYSLNEMVCRVSRPVAVLIAFIFAAHAAGAGWCDMLCASAEWFTQSGFAATHHPAAGEPDCHSALPLDAGSQISSTDAECEHAPAMVASAVDRPSVTKPAAAAERLASSDLFQRELPCGLFFLPIADPPGVRGARAVPLRL